MILTIKPVNCLPPEFDCLLEESRSEGFNFLARLENEFRTGVNRFSRHGEALYSCSLDNALIAIGGVTIQSSSQGRVRRFYVSARVRKTGVGSRLHARIETDASAHFRELVLNTDSKAAALFYENRGYILVTNQQFSHSKRLSK